MKEQKHSGNDTSVTLTHTKKSITTGRLAPVMIGSLTGSREGVGSGNHPNCRKNLKPAKKKEFSKSSWEDFYGGDDLYQGPLGPFIDPIGDL